MYPSVLRSFRRPMHILAACLFVAVLFSAARASQFRTAQTFRTAADPHSIALADFNRDGNLDAVLSTGDISTNTVQVALSNGNGTFGRAVTYRLTSSSNDVAVGDFNNDGMPDIAAATMGGVNVLLGNGDGTFQSAIVTNYGSDEATIRVGDFNGDGNLDLLSSDAPFNVDMMLGNGDGSFQPPVTVGSWTRGRTAIGDFNGDGKLDFAVISSNIDVFIGNGDGGFQLPHSYDYSFLSANPVDLVAADFTNDGKTDLALLGYQLYADLSAYIFVYAGNGDGTFHPGKSSSSTTDEGPISFAAGDVNGDGKTDLVVANWVSNDVSVMLGRGNGNFDNAVNWATGNQTANVAIGDVNNDGIADVLATTNSGDVNSPGSVAVLLGTGGGGLFAARDFAAGYTPFFVTSGDFNGDGIADLVTAVQYPSALWISMGIGKGVFAPPTEKFLRKGATQGVARDTIAADLNGDGHIDLVFAYWSSNGVGSRTVGVLLGNGDGTFQQEIDYTVKGNGIVNLVIGDFNRDGIPDIAACTVYGASPDLFGSVYLFLGNGDGTFQTATTLSMKPYNPSWMAQADFNNDGNLDLAFTGYDLNLNPVVLLALGNGDGTFQPIKKTGSLSYPFSVFLASADLNQDGFQDLVSVNYDGSRSFNTVSVLLGDGNGSFLALVDYNAGPWPTQAAIADYNLDGIPDIAVSIRSGNVGLLLGKGDGTFTNAPVTAAGNSPLGLVSADFNGDSRPDLAVVNELGNNVTVLLNTAP